MNIKEILAGMALGVVVQFEVSAIVAELQVLHDKSPEEYKIAIQVEFTEIKRVQALLVNSKSTILHSLLNGFDQAFKQSAQTNGLTLSNPES